MNDGMRPQAYSAIFESRLHLSKDYYLLKFGLGKGQALAFRAGQYVSFHIGPPKMRHTMSLASPPRADSFEILQCVAPGGSGSQWTLRLSPGQSVQFTGPLGKFGINATSPQKKIFVATGCGIAPFRSMIIDYLGKGGKSEIVLYWGMRHETDLFWQKELSELSARYPNFHYQITLSQPEDSWRGIRGRVTDHVVQQEKDLTGPEFYLCGSQAMISDVRQQLLDKNVPPEQIYNETFY